MNSSLGKDMEHSGSSPYGREESLRPGSPLISVVVPVFNEEDCLRELATRVERAVVGDCKARLELLFVDDGSTDGTAETIELLHLENGAIKGMHLTRSFGHQAAIKAGLDNACGDVIITMDGDLQHPPESIPELVRRWRNGAEVVHTVRRNTVGENCWVKSLTAKAYYHLFDRLSAVKMVHGGADFRLMDRWAVDQIKRLDERFLFLRGLIPWMGLKSDLVEYEVAPRFAGSAKFRLRKMLALAADGVFSFSVVPLRIIILVGLLTTGAGLLYGLFAVGSYLLTDRVTSGWTSLMVVVLLFGGIQLLALGIVSEYLGRIYEEIKRRPRFVVSKVTGAVGVAIRDTRDSHD